ncbi:MAG TPA: SpoIIE family protein phosphatase [Ardenticatenaceae bacterium]|jgi:serine phosphatase RsbU (regulator of sigma subunit)/putative methionine-R-sulfoxide reductase with GAF domain
MLYSWRSLLYRLLIIAAGIGWLIWSLRQTHPPIDWEVVGIFLLLSAFVKRAGFRIATDVTHSLVNMVDVAALLVLGPAGGAIVASISSILNLQFSILFRRPQRRWYDMIDLPLFDGGIKALLALAGGNYYLQMGGVLEPTGLTTAMLLPLVVLYLFWFSLDHLLWGWLFLVSGGVRRAREFIQQITTTSLVVELAPLPFSIVLAVSWVIFDPLLRSLLMIGAVILALVVRGFALSLGRAESRVSTVMLLNRFAQATLLAQLDEEKLAELLYDYAPRILPNARFELVLLEGNDHARPILPSPEQESRLLPFIPLIAPILRERPRGRLLSTLTAEALAEEAERTAAERPNRGGVLLIPLVASDALLGILMVEGRGRKALTLDDGRSVSIMATQAAVALQNARSFRREQWRARQLHAIAQVSRLVASVIKLDDLLWEVVELLRATFGYYHVQIYLVAPDANEVVFRAGSGEAGQKLAKLPMHLEIGREGIIGWVAGMGEPLLVSDVSQDSRYIPDLFHLLPNTRMELAVPLKVEERVLGVLDVQSDCFGGLDDEDLFTLTTLGDQLAIAIEEAQLVVAQREAAWVSSGLLKFAEALNPLFELPVVLETITRIMPRLVGGDVTAIYRWHAEDRTFEGVASFGLASELAPLLVGHRIAPDDFPLLARAREENQLVPVERVSRSRLVSGPLAQAGLMGLIALPMQSQGEFVGVLLLGYRSSLPRLSDRRRALVSGIAQQAAVSIQAATLIAQRDEEAAITGDLLQVAELIASRSDLKQILELVTRVTVRVAQVDRCVVYLWDEEKGVLEPAEAHGFSPQVEAAWLETTLRAEEMASFVVLWDASDPILLGDGARHPLGCKALQTLFNGCPIAAMPLRAHNAFFGLLLVDQPPGTTRLSRRLQPVLTGIARQLSVALENSLLYDEALENTRRTQELILARQIQSALLPDGAPEVPGYDMAGYWRPAREVAGDFYDFLELSEGRHAFSIADVADKGIGAALFMVLARTALRESLWSEEEVGRALERANALLSADVRNGMFLTAFLGLLTPATGRVQAANAGHIPPVIYRAADGSLSSPIQRNLPLGVLPDTRYTTIDLLLGLGDVMVLVTDGIMDTMNHDHELYGLERLSELVYDHRDDDARGIVNAILDAAIAHAQGEPFDDDLTIIVIRRAG